MIRYDKPWRSFQNNIFFFKFCLQIAIEIFSKKKNIQKIMIHSGDKYNQVRIIQ